MLRDLYEDYFENRKITVMGLGLLGRGVGDTEFLAKMGAELIVTEKKTKEELAPSLEKLANYPGIVYEFGGHTVASFQKRDFILKSAGVPYDSEHIAYAKSTDTPVYMSAALVTQIVSKHVDGVTIIGVTGTRGKSTCTELIAHILRTAGYRVHLGGNVRGVANLPLLEVIEEGDYLVLELDSWQLQGFGDLKLSPQIAVFTSFLDDHMNYYHNDKELYFADKAQIYRHQGEYDVLIASAQARDEISKRDPKKDVLVGERRKFDTRLIGEHNQVLASLAYEVAAQCAVEEVVVLSSIASFAPVEGRLEDCGMYNNDTVRVINDNNATTGDAVIAAIKAVQDAYGRKPILILGGADKGLPLTLLEEEVLIGAKHYVLLEGTGTQKLTLSKDSLFETLEECVERAMYLGEEGDIILFSPGFASFSKYFKNEYERNDTFKKSIEKYKVM